MRSARCEGIQDSVHGLEAPRDGRVTLSMTTTRHWDDSYLHSDRVSTLTNLSFGAAAGFLVQQLPKIAVAAAT